MSTSTLSLTTWSIPTAGLGEKNPLPQLEPLYQHEIEAETDDSIPPEDRAGLNEGIVRTCLPYRLLDGYDRRRKPKEQRVAVFENETLRATWLLEHGGRLWSLVHKPSGRELLYVNPVIQPANLALRNAWISGGVEWNVSVRGHAAYTCSPIFAAAVTRPDGEPALRLFEYDRFRGAVFQIDAWLPTEWPVLLVRVRITNPNDHVIPMYWWSNIAVPEAPDVRVLVPADRAYKHGYKGSLHQVAIPMQDGRDVTYPTNAPTSGDFFYRIPDGHRRWIAAVDGNGTGLFQTSTSRLIGRKLFVWGMGPGGRRWQDFLTEPGHPYIELQAGLSWTQSHTTPMPGGETWTWLEAYGLLDVDPTAAHGRDWQAAWSTAEAAIEATIPDAALEQALTDSAPAAEQPTDFTVEIGSGWGALEHQRRIAAGLAPISNDATPFGDAPMGPDQQPWLSLLRDGVFPERSPDEPPGAWMVQPAWREMLRASVEAGRSDHWLAWLHLGVMAYHAGELETAEGAWQRSLDRAPSAWALRNLAVLRGRQGQSDEAADLILRALRMRPDLKPLVVECLTHLREADRPEQALRVIADLPDRMRNDGRVRALEAWACVELDDLDRAEAILAGDFELITVREGEVLLTDLWYACQARRLAAREGTVVNEDLIERVRTRLTPPAHLDFRMAATKESE